MKSVAILQSNYIPWKGYFDIINDVDLFIFYDDVQFTKNDWRNRNKIKTPSGTSWLTIPVGSHIDLKICDVLLPKSNWQEKHWKTICQNYSNTPYFNYYSKVFEEIYLGMNWLTLSELNQYIIKRIASDMLSINTQFSDSRAYSAIGAKQDRLLDILRKVGANLYVSGPAAKDYIDIQGFSDAGIELIYKDYSGYPEYNQQYPPYDQYISILDLLFQVGPKAPWYIWGWRK